jgi:hypothetical protein
MAALSVVRRLSLVVKPLTTDDRQLSARFVGWVAQRATHPTPCATFGFG